MTRAGGSGMPGAGAGLSSAKTGATPRLRQTSAANVADERRAAERGKVNMRWLSILLILLCLGLPAPVLAADGPASPVHAALLAWTKALASGQGEAPIAALYAPDAILLSTFDPK